MAKLGKHILIMASAVWMALLVTHKSGKKRQLNYQTENISENGHFVAKRNGKIRKARFDHENGVMDKGTSNA